MIRSCGIHILITFVWLVSSTSVVYCETDTPPIAAPSQGNALPAGWSFWSMLRDCASADFSENPINHMAVRMGNSGQWALTSSTFDVNAGDVWTFTAVVAGRSAGWLSSAGASLNIYASDDKGNITNWALGERWEAGTFTWKRMSVTVTVPQGVAKLTPRFCGHGGGEFFVASASFKKTDKEDSLSIPTSDIPPTKAYDIALPVTQTRDGAIYNLGDTTTWQVAPSCSRPDISAKYTIQDPYGKALETGSVNLSKSISYKPASMGYYELKLQETFNQPDITGTLKGVSGAGVLAVPANWSIGGNPFGGEVSQRLGLTWARPLYYNIASGAHNQLPTDLPAYEKAWTTKIKSGMPASELKTIEIWNEPYNEIPGLKMPDFVSMLSAARKGILKADPSFKIAVNLEWVSTFKTLNDAGGTHLYDIMVLHPYSMSLWANPPSADSPEKAGLLEYLESAHKLLKSYGLNKVDIWSTEYGWPTHPGYGWSCTELNQARYIVRSSLLQLAQGLKRVLPFNFQDVTYWDDMNGSFGLRRTDGTPKPSLIAYSNLAQIVNNLPYAGRFDLGYPNLAALVFGKSNSRKSILVLWSAGKEQSISLKLPVGKKIEHGLFGDSKIVSSTGYTQTVGKSPFYIVMDASPQVVAEAIGKHLITGRPVNIFRDVAE